MKGQRLGKCIAAGVICAAIFGLLAGCCTNARKTADRVKNAVGQLSLLADSKIGSGFQMELARARQSIEKDGIPGKPSLVIAVLVTWPSDMKRGLLDLVWVSKSRNMKGLRMRVVPAAAKEHTEAEFTCNFIALQKIAGRHSHVTVLQQAIDIKEVQNIKTFEETGEVGWSLTPQPIDIPDEDASQFVMRLLTDGQLVTYYATYLVIVLPKRYVQKSDFYVKVFDADGNESNELKVQRMILERQ